jgi:membrane protease YdiL (CAAX protease family)
VGRSASTYLHLMGGLGPVIAAVVVTAMVAGRAGAGDPLRRAVSWCGRLRWSAGRGGSTGPVRVAVLVARVVEGTWPDLGRFRASTEYPALPLAMFWLVNLLFYGSGEEIGWRVFAQPMLERRRSPLRAALVIG